MKGLAKTVLSRPEITALVVMIVLGAIFFINTPVFLSAGNWRVLFGIIPELGLLALGVTVLMIAGEFDLSVGSMFALGGMLPVLLNQMGGRPVGLPRHCHPGRRQRRLHQRLRHADLRHSLLHYDAGHDVRCTLGLRGHFGRPHAGVDPRFARQAVHRSDRRGRIVQGFVRLVRRASPSCWGG